jgi:hypothetical protein
MTELEILDRDIRGLKDLIQVAWTELASPFLTPHERREARNRLTIYSAELRRHLDDAEQRHFRKPAAQAPGGRARAKPRLRLLPEGY